MYRRIEQNNEKKSLTTRLWFLELANLLFSIPFFMSGYIFYEVTLSNWVKWGVFVWSCGNFFITCFVCQQLLKKAEFE